jgi:hypothetical protein
LVCAVSARRAKRREELMRHAPVLMKESPLDCLIGGHLDTVSFVMDYVEFRIGYNVVRALTNPTVSLADGQSYCFPDEGSRDALCRLIDSEVVTAKEIGEAADDDRRLEFETDAGHTLVIPLDWDSLNGAEGAHLVPADGAGRSMGGRMFIWRAD